MSLFGLSHNYDRVCDVCFRSLRSTSFLRSLNDDVVKCILSSRPTYYLAWCLDFLVSWASKQISAGWLFFAGQYIAIVIKRPVLWPNFLRSRCYKRPFLKTRSAEKLEVSGPKAIKFDRFEFSRFHYLWSFAVLFLDSASLFGFLSKSYGFLASKLKLFFWMVI